MTLWTCGTWTYAARLCENCVKCAGRGCDCCEQSKRKGMHLEPGAMNQRDNINANFAAKNTTEAMLARSARRERLSDV